MYTPIDFEEDYIVGMRLEGNIGQNSFIQAMQRIIPEMESKEHFHLYLEVAPENIDPELIWESLKFGITESKEYIKRMDKIALVTDKSWIKTLGEVEQKIISGIDEKAFSFEEKDEAIKYIATRNGSE